MIADYLQHARWFAGKGRRHGVTGVRRLATLPATAVGDPEIRVELVTVAYDNGEFEHYQLPLAVYDEHVERLGHALVDPHEHAYDAVHDRAAMARLLDAFAAASPDELVGDGEAPEPGELRFHRLIGHDLDLGAHSTLFSGEQSNSSVAFGDDSLLKLFRKVTPGINPDIEIHRALTRAGSDHVAALYGWLEADLDGEVVHLGMLQQFLRTASDGWDLACASVRTVLSEWEGLDAPHEASGADFGGEAERLGLACREVHETLATTFGTATVDSADVADAMTARLEQAALDVPALQAHVPALRDVFDRVRQTGSVPAQRVHGDLHLGQTLRTTRGWKLVDFEGEPAKPLAERMLPDSPWRDVAGMLRSFDYAARSVARDFVEPEHHSAERAGAWAADNRERLLAGYGDADPGLLAAYEADKAVYEVVYEARNRPTWIDIPLGALERIGGTA